MEEERESTRYWCHQCSREVDPIMEVEMVKCSLCHGGFMEEMDSIRNDYQHHHHHGHGHGGGGGGDSDSGRALSLWAPVLLGMMSNPRRRRRFRQLEFDENDNNEERDEPEDRYHRRHHFREGEESELDREIESIMRLRRRRRSSATILQLLQGIRAGMITESENIPDRESGGDGHRERQRVILINPFNQTIIVQGGGASGGNLFDPSNPSQNHQIGSLGDYFVGPGLELLLQHLAENDPNRYGTPPAQKEAVEAMPTVTIVENLIQCSVCLDDLEIGTEAKEMPCKHMFHSGCILPWLELHSSCPVCRYQLPSDESKLVQERDRASGITGNSNGIVIESENIGNGEDGDDVNVEGRNGRRFSVSLPWPFNSLFSSTSGPQMGNPHLMTSTPSSSGSGSGSGSGSLPPAHEADGGSRRDDHQ